ncbi:MAG: FecR domain-containing protein [Prolixibacteraceae bacterium]|nr:FecR domain-containing protein [Prolixibacteraceae bacterium]MBN2774200.1 FecR domain-containing protein [Prolixibacteraceae bacterium]
MEEKYLKYSVEDFTQDLEFIKWVKRGKNKYEWESLLHDNPDLASKIEIAKKIVKSLQSSDLYIKEEEVNSVWRKIEEFYISQNRRNKGLHIRKMVLRYAAVFIFLLTFGSIASYFYFKRDYNVFPQMEFSSSFSDDAKLILPGGEEILLKEKQSDLEFDASGKQVTIDKDSVIDYQVKSTKDEMAQVIIPYGKRSDILLSDGTKVWLNAGSKLAFPSEFTKKTREVYLEGEAYFEVAHRKEQPFIVNVNELNIKVLGTRFDISAYASDNDIYTILLEGSVSISKPSNFGIVKNEILLKPNQKASFNKQTKEVLLSNESESDYYTAWTEGWFQFRQENLTAVLIKLERYYNVKFVLNPAFYPSELISGKLDLKESLQEVLAALSDVAPIDFRINDGIVNIDKKIENIPLRR